MSAPTAPPASCDVLAAIDTIHAITRRITDDLALTIRYSSVTAAGHPWPPRTFIDYDGDARTVTIRDSLTVPELQRGLAAVVHLCVLGPSEPDPHPPRQARHLSLVPSPRRPSVIDAGCADR